MQPEEARPASSRRWIVAAVILAAGALASASLVATSHRGDPVAPRGSFLGAQTQLRAHVQQQHELIRTECWPVRRTDHVTLRVRVGYDARGAAVLRNVTRVRGEDADRIADCVGALSLSLGVIGVGQAIEIDAPIGLPAQTPADDVAVPIVPGV